MLVLSRSPRDSTYIEHAGEILKVVVVSVSDGKARLGFDGPQSFAIARHDAHGRLKSRRQGRGAADGVEGSSDTDASTGTDDRRGPGPRPIPGVSGATSPAH